MRFLLGRRDQLYPFEACVIEAIKSRLDSDGAMRLQGQINSINKVQRLTDGKDVSLYRIARGKPAFDDSLRFPWREGEPCSLQYTWPIQTSP
jgi:hypothetical protein